MLHAICVVTFLPVRCACPQLQRLRPSTRTCAAHLAQSRKHSVCLAKLRKDSKHATTWPPVAKPGKQHYCTCIYAAYKAFLPQHNVFCNTMQLWPRLQQLMRLVERMQGSLLATSCRSGSKLGFPHDQQAASKILIRSMFHVTHRPSTLH